LLRLSMPDWLFDVFPCVEVMFEFTSGSTHEYLVKVKAFCT
jgi:hypothetical protein